MRKPIVAVTADTLLADMKPINQKMADYAPRPLLNALGRAGLLPIILAYDDYAGPEEYVDSFDALVLSGGPNPAPRFYGEEPLWCIGPTYEKRDIFEIGLIKACLKADKPILGICRGHQILNVALGGKLWQDMQAQNPKAFAGRGSRYLAEKIVASYGTKLGESEVLNFSDGEFQPCFLESIRGCTVFVIQSTFPPTDNLMELLMMIDAAKRASAHQVIAVMPYFGWARQDRKDRPRVPIGAKLVANLLVAAGVDRIMTMDLHADQIQGFFDVPVDALYASGIFVPYIQSLNIEDLSIAAPDMGGAKRANTYAKYLHTPIIISHKERAKANVVGKMTAIGDVEGRNIIIVDDMIDTAGTICMAADMLMKKGAKSVRAAITHPVLSGSAYDKINDSALQEVIVTDTIPLREGEDLRKFTVLSVADIFADVVERVHNYKEISSIFFK